MTRLTSWLHRHLIADAAPDAGHLDILDRGRVRECRSDTPIYDELTVEHRAEIEGVQYAIDVTDRPHEGTADERTGSAS